MPGGKNMQKIDEELCLQLIKEGKGNSLIIEQIDQLCNKQW